MIEPIMYSGIGFLFAALIGLVVMPRIHDRAVRLTMRRLEAAIPLSMAEIQADKDLLRAEFAMSTRRLEISVEQFRNKTTGQLAELGKKGDAINQLKIERDAQKVEIIAFNSQLELLKQQLTSAGKQVGAEVSTISLVPKDWPTAGLAKAPMNSLQSTLNDQLYDDGVVSLLPKEVRPVEEARSGEPVCDPATGCVSSDQRSRMPRGGYDFSAGLRALEPSMHVSDRPFDFKNDQFAGERLSVGGRIFRRLAHLFIAALIGISAMFAWQSYGDKAKELIGTWTSSLGGFLPVPTTKSLVDVPARQPSSIPANQVSAQDAAIPQSVPVTQGLKSTAAVTSPEAAQQHAKTVERNIPTEHPNTEQPAVKREQIAPNIATPQVVERNITQKTSSAPQMKLTPVPETRPTTIEGWTLREISNGTAVLEGPNGIWRATRGDTLPGVGRIDFIVRWGNRWIVATSRGLISTP